MPRIFKLSLVEWSTAHCTCQVKSLYEQEDPTNTSLRRESAELYFKENVPPLVFSQAFEVNCRIFHSQKCLPGEKEIVLQTKRSAKSQTNHAHEIRK